MSKEWIQRQMTSSAYAGTSQAPNYWNGYVSKVQQELKEEDPHKLLYYKIAHQMEEAGCNAFKDFLSDSKYLRKEMADTQYQAHAECLYTGGAADFLMDVFKSLVVEFLWQYKVYCSITPSSKEHNCPLVEDKLITSCKDVKMFYKHYGYGICYLLGVKPVGLLDNANAPVNPTKITTLACLQSTLDVLVTSKMHWWKMTATEWSKHIGRGAKSKETVLSEDEGEEDIKDKREDAVRDEGKENVEDKGKDAVNDAGEDENEKEEESAAAAKKTAVAKACARLPKTKPVCKATSAWPTPKTKGVPKAKWATAKAKYTTPHGWPTST
ncbi:hypothetical protein C8F04DRAFT_1199474 [Mycena alexandri]|uniref:Uncharacterized protein n=1 Tax=Mycena alexandri TaxID=1745969 RepID=A0AAD6WL70_9AGAR|nr:hypothetical protein C8F04DRAFT_1199474 [Mycena alexandri]